MTAEDQRLREGSDARPSWKFWDLTSANGNGERHSTSDREPRPGSHEKMVRTRGHAGAYLAFNKLLDTGHGHRGKRNSQGGAATMGVWAKAKRWLSVAAHASISPVNRT